MPSPLNQGQGHQVKAKARDNAKKRPLGRPRQRPDIPNAKIMVKANKIGLKTKAKD